MKMTDQDVRRAGAALAVSMTFFLAGCRTAPEAPSPSQARFPARNEQLNLSLASGSYRCDDSIRIQVDREVREQMNTRIKIGWRGSDYTLERDPSYSGLPRFEHLASGLVWIDLPWKSVLLDARTNQPLANECHPA
ncbi:MAG: hypothetical protein ACM3X0_00580 [Bacteroidota bacterium]